MNKKLLILHSQLNDMKLWAHPGNFLLLQQLSCLRYLAFLLTRGEKPLDPVPGFRSRRLGDSGTLLCAWERGDSTCSASGKAAVVSKQTENVKEEGPKQQSKAVLAPEQLAALPSVPTQVLFSFLKLERLLVGLGCAPKGPWLLTEVFYPFLC